MLIVTLVLQIYQKLAKKEKNCDLGFCILIFALNFACYHDFWIWYHDSSQAGLRLEAESEYAPLYFRETNYWLTLF
jgi:hypothetical protein